MSSDSDLIRLFLKWLKEIGEIKNEEIGFDIFIGKRDSIEAVDYWSDQVGFPKNSFTHIYFQRKNKAQRGLLRIRVKASSMLARQIAGWIGGIRERIYR